MDPKCLLCGKPKTAHQPVTFNCPWKHMSAAKAGWNPNSVYFPKVKV